MQWIHLTIVLQICLIHSIIVLIIAAIVSGVVGVAQGEGFTDTIIILIVVILNAVIGVAQESKAEKSLEALKKLREDLAKMNHNNMTPENEQSHSRR